MYMQSIPFGINYYNCSLGHSSSSHLLYYNFIITTIIQLCQQKYLNTNYSRRMFIRDSTSLESYVRNIFY